MLSSSSSYLIIHRISSAVPTGIRFIMGETQVQMGSEVKGCKVGGLRQASRTPATRLGDCATLGVCLQVQARSRRDEPLSLPAWTVDIVLGESETQDIVVGRGGGLHSGVPV